MTPNTEAIAKWLEDHGEDLMRWKNGCVEIDTYREKQFRDLGGDTMRLVANFEDYKTVREAVKRYIKDLE